VCYGTFACQTNANTRFFALINSVNNFFSLRSLTPAQGWMLFQLTSIEKKAVRLKFQFSKQDSGVKFLRYGIVVERLPSIPFLNG
jgi:hypothetical protein